MPEDSNAETPTEFYRDKHVAEALFADFVQRADAGSEFDIDALCAQHENHAEELRLLHAQWSLLAPLQPGADEESTDVGAGRVLGDFRLERQLGRGGMGEVWEAEQISLRRRVALKLLRPGLSTTGRERTRFDREAEAGARLSHPSIVTVYGTGEWQGQAYIAQELVPGGTNLLQVLDQARGRPEHTRDEYLWIARFFSRCADALQTAHDAGVIHRDIKPANILLARDMTPKITDFGLAALVDRDPVSVTGEFSGTYLYMSPEQAMAKRIGIDHRTDVFSLGATLYEALTLTRPFEGDTPHQVTEKIILHDPPEPRRIRSRVPTELATICMKAIEKHRDRRYQSMREFADDLERFLRREPIHAKLSGAISRVTKWMVRPPAVTVVATTVPTALVVVLLLLSDNIAARRATENTLRESLIAQAQTIQLSSSVGHQFDGIARLQDAAAIAPGTDIAEAAIASMTLADAKKTHEVAFEDGQASATFNHDLTRYAIANADGGISVHRAADDGQITTVDTDDRAWVIVFSRDGNFLAAKSHPEGKVEGQILQIWGLPEGKQLLRRDARVGNDAMQFSVDSSELFVGFADGSVVAYSMPSGELREVGEPREILPVSDYGAFNLAMNPDPRETNFALSRSSDADVRDIEILDLEGNLLNTIEVPSLAHRLAFSPDGDYLVAGCSDRLARVWKTTDWSEHQILQGHGGEVVRASFGPLSRLVLTYSWDGYSRIFDAHSGELLVWMQGDALEFSHEKRQFAMRDEISASIWDVDFESVNSVLHCPPESSQFGMMAFSPEGGWLASVTGREMYWFELAKGRLRSITLGEFESVVFVETGTFLLTTGPDGLLRHEAHSIVMQREGPPPTVLLEGRLLSSAASSDNRLVAVINEVDDEIRKIQIVRPGSSTPTQTLGEYPGMSHIAMSGDGRLVATGSWRGAGAVVWDTSTGERLAHLLPDERNVTVEISPDGRRMVTGGDGKYAIWDTATWQRIVEIDPMGVPSEQAKFSPDGRILALAWTGGDIRLVSADRTEVGLTLPGPESGRVAGLSFGSSGTMLAVQFATRQIHIWHLDRIRQRLEELDLSEGVDALELLPDNR